MKTLRLLTLLACIFGPAATAAQAATLVQYAFPDAHGAGVETGSGFSPTTVDAGLDALFDMAVKDSSGNVSIGTENPSPNYVTEPVLRVDPLGGANSAAAAVANSVYFSFAIAPEAGKTLGLTNLTFDAARGGGATPRGWALRSSVDGFAADISSADIPTQRQTFTPYDISLGDPQYQGLSSSVEFRFYVYSPSSGSTVEFDNITLNGTVVPEPAGIALIALGAMGCWPLLRRRKRRVC